MINLVKASMKDCKEIHSLQTKAFGELLRKYNDVSTNPGAESVEKIAERMVQPFTDYYLIKMNNVNIGAIRVRKDNDICTISPIFIIPEYRNKGYAQEAILKVEGLYPDATSWQLATIKEEESLCYFYEKLGYHRTGSETKIKDGMTIIGYAK